jgi:hypothetical protein
MDPEKPTTAIGNVCHLATGHNVAFGILDHLGRRLRRRLGGDCDRVHRVAHRLGQLTHGVERAHDQTSKLRSCAGKLASDRDRHAGAAASSWRWLLAAGPA